MGIRVAKTDMQPVLDTALRDARNPHVTVDAIWEARIKWLSDQVTPGSPSGLAYVPAVGAALLAKATEPQVDTLTQATGGGPRGYSMRSVAEFLAEKVRGIAHLGTLSKWPVNGAPFLRGPARVDRLVVAGFLRHIYETYLDWMRELDGYDAQEAYDALVAFLRVRILVQQAEDVAAATGQRMTAATSLADLLDVVQLWTTEDPEEGARGQALVSAALDLIETDVAVVPKHHPSPFDVRAGDPARLVCECKQQIIAEADVIELARRAAEHDVDHAIYAALDPGQPPLPADRLRRDALERHGTLLDVIHDAHELVVRVCVIGGVPADDAMRLLPQALADRCPQAGVSAAGLSRLAGLLGA